MGPIDTTMCTSDLPAQIPVQSPGDIFALNVYFYDAYGNRHYNSAQFPPGMDVQAHATYSNHDKWDSSVGVPDYAGWQTTYGLSHSFGLSD